MQDAEEQGGAPAPSVSRRTWSRIREESFKWIASHLYQQHHTGGPYNIISVGAIQPGKENFSHEYEEEVFVSGYFDAKRSTMFVGIHRDVTIRRHFVMQIIGVTAHPESFLNCSQIDDIVSLLKMQCSMFF